MLRKCFSRQKGRLTLSLLLEQCGKDLLCAITGGEEHIGAVALCYREGAEGEMRIESLVLPHHREDEIVGIIASALFPYWKGTILVRGGIHYPEITREEIEDVYSLVDALLEDAKKELHTLHEK